MTTLSRIITSRKSSRVRFSAKMAMKHIQQLFTEGVFCKPVCDIPSSVHLSRAVMHIAGSPNCSTLSPLEKQLVEHIGKPRHLVFVLADGLGSKLLEQRESGSFLRHFNKKNIQSVFPSTTAAALTSIATASWPGEHAVTGWFAYLAEHNIPTQILMYQHRFSRKSLLELGIQPQMAFPVPSGFANVHRQFCMYQPKKIAGSVYSTFQSGSAENCFGYDSIANAIDGISRVIKEDNGDTLQYFYIPDVDVAAHVHGIRSEQVNAAIDQVERAIFQLSQQLKGCDATIVIRYASFMAI